MRGKPLRLHPVAGKLQIGNHVGEILSHEMRQQIAVVQNRPPAHEGLPIGRPPKPRDQRPNEQLLRQAHASMRRHFEGAKFQQSQSARRCIGREQLVDAKLGSMGVACQIGQQMAKHAVDQPRRAAAAIGNLLKRDLELVQTVVPRFVDPRRLARRPDECSAEQMHDSDGWLFQYASSERSKSGRRRNGLSAGVGPPSTT